MTLDQSGESQAYAALRLFADVRVSASRHGVDALPGPGRLSETGAAPQCHETSFLKATAQQSRVSRVEHTCIPPEIPWRRHSKVAFVWK